MATTIYPPGPRRIIPGGHLMALRCDPTGFLLKLARRYGDIALLRLGPQQIFLLNHPDYIHAVLVTNQRNFIKGRALPKTKRMLGEGLVTSEGELHLRQRRLVQPAFHRQRLAVYASIIARHAAEIRIRWQDGATRDIAKDMSDLTLAVIGRTLFGAEMDESHGIGAALETLIELFGSTLSPFAGLLERLPLPTARRFEQAQQRLDATVYRLIAERRASGEDRGDLLSMLLLAQDDEQGGHMDDTQVRDEAMTLLVAGHETIANALTWAWYLLSQHPEIEARLHAELDAALADRLPTFDDLARLPYAHMVLSESLRLYPPSWILGRHALADCPIGAYIIPANALVLMSQWVMHHDPRYYPDPFRFDPERWTPAAQAARPKYAFFPFGGGARVCIGESFAYMAGMLLLATLAQQWRMRLAPGHRVALQPLMSLRPRYGMRMRLELRLEEGGAW
jgi:cytochrome P450